MARRADFALKDSPTASQYFAGRNKVRGRVQEREEGNRLAKILFFFAERMVVRKV